MRFAHALGAGQVRVLQHETRYRDLVVMSHIFFGCKSHDLLAVKIHFPLELESTGTHKNILLPFFLIIVSN